MMIGRSFLLLSSYLCLHISEVNCHLIDDLTDHIFRNYSTAVRPQCRSHDTTTVDLYMSLRQIIDIDEPQQLVKINVWVRMTWHDCRLVWNPPDFGNITAFVVPYNNVWVPDITLYDNVEPALSGLKDYRAQLDSTGELKYNFPSLITSICALDIRYFPFDFQTCALTFGSWAYNGFDVNVTRTSDKIELDSFIKNSEWRMIDAYITREEPLFDDIPFPTVIFHMDIQRKPLFYLVNVVFPCLLITFVAVLGFLLPPDSGEKISLQVTVLLSLAVFQLVILDMIPASGDSFPFISVYFTLSMLIVALSCLMTVVVLRVHFKGKYGVQLSERVRKYFLIPLTKITFIDLKKYSLHPMKTKVYDDNFNPVHERITTPEHMEMQDCESYHIHKDKQVADYMESILYSLKQISEFLTHTDEQHDIEKWWNVFSQAFDRLFLLFYIFCTLAVALILTAPSLSNKP